MDPLISVKIWNDERTLAPADALRFACQVDGVSTSDVTAIEASVLWRTEGKGEEDIGVHFFERMTRVDDEDDELLAQKQFETALPRSPLSYEGVILKIRWAVRVRVFLRSGKDYYLDAPFQLGKLVQASSEQDAEEEAEEGAEGLV